MLKENKKAREKKNYPGFKLASGILILYFVGNNLLPLKILWIATGEPAHFPSEGVYSVLGVAQRFQLLATVK